MRTSSFVNFGHVEEPPHSLHSYRARTRSAREGLVAREPRQQRSVRAELEQALKIVARLPGAGTLYAQSPIAGVRRIYLRRVVAHLYYTFDDDEVIIRALWGARRERGPGL